MEEMTILQQLEHIMHTIIGWLTIAREPFFGLSFLDVTISIGVTTLIVSFFTGGDTDDE